MLVRPFESVPLASSILLALTLSTGCADRSVTTASGETGVQEVEPGEAFSECIDENDCFIEWCAHPAGEPGFCTSACADVSECLDGPSGTATATCLPVGDDQVCALDCEGPRTCPNGMRCESIESEGMARRICF